MHRIEFSGSENNTIVADLYSPEHASKDAPVALLIHGGGQTRYSWAGAAKKLAQAGWHAIAMDQRGHGESDWVESGDYSFGRFGEDLRAIAGQIDGQFGVKPVVIGASLGGMASMIAEGEGGGGAVSAVVLVDVTPRMDPAGVAKVQGFMRARMEEGFASIEEAADAVAEYLPHRKRPPTTEGLKKNLRKHEDGRYRWHWDPRFMQRGAPSQADREGFVKRLSEAAANLKVPVLLVRRARKRTCCGRACPQLHGARATCALRGHQRRGPHGRRRPQRYIRAGRDRFPARLSPRPECAVVG